MTDFMQKIKEHEHLVEKQVRARLKDFGEIPVDVEDMKQAFLILLAQAVGDYYEHEENKASFDTFYGGIIEKYCKYKIREYTRRIKSSSGKILNGVMETSDDDFEQYGENDGYGRESLLFDIAGQDPKVQYKVAPSHRLKLMFRCNGEVVAKRLMKTMREQGGTYRTLTKGNDFLVFTTVKPRLELNELFGIELYALAYEPWEELAKRIATGRANTQTECMVLCLTEASVKRLKRQADAQGIERRTFEESRHFYTLLSGIPIFEKEKSTKDMFFLNLKHQPWDTVHHDLTACTRPIKV